MLNCIYRFDGQGVFRLADQSKWQPAYLKMPAEERKERIAALHEKMKSCTICPRNCGVDRLQNKTGKCGAPMSALISSIGPHYGEEKVLVGPGGSGTIFFTHCNLECLFCQNWTISRGYEGGEEVSTAELASLMLSLQRRGCSNINLVTPTPYIYQFVSALNLAAEDGLTLPVIYNCGGYESLEALQLLEGFIDIYMPDAKYGADDTGEIYSGIPDYFSRMSAALQEMQRQVGDLQLDNRGLATRGLLVRHLVMPADISGSESVASFISTEVSPHSAVNVMDQYHPAYRAADYPWLKRRITAEEYRTAREAFRKAGLKII